MKQYLYKDHNVVTIKNPASICAQELYGEFNDESKEWKDGVLTAEIRKAVV